jgi:hypothetical protein
VRRTSGLRSGNVVELLGDTLVCGGHLRSMDELRVSRASVRLRGLLQFLRGAPGNLGLFPVNVTRDTSEELLVDCSWGGIGLTVSAEESYGGMDRNSVALVGRATMCVSAPAAWPEFEAQILDPLSDLVLFAIREPTWLDRIEVVTEAMMRAPGAGARALTVVRRPVVQAVSEPSEYPVLALTSLGSPIHAP